MSEYRQCIVNNERMLFHKWEDVANENSKLFNRMTLGIVEDSKGQVQEVIPSKIIFIHNPLTKRMYYFENLSNERRKTDEKEN